MLLKLPTIAEFQSKIMLENNDTIQLYINQLENLIEIAHESKKQNDQISDTSMLAVVLHEMTCNINHDDGCSWYYEINNGQHDWSGHVHKHYKEKAVVFMKNMHELIGRNPTMAEVKKTIQLVKGY